MASTNQPGFQWQLKNFNFTINVNRFHYLNCNCLSVPLPVLSGVAASELLHFKQHFSHFQLVLFKSSVFAADGSTPHRVLTFALMFLRYFHVYGLCICVSTTQHPLLWLAHIALITLSKYRSFYQWTRFIMRLPSFQEKCNTLAFAFCLV